MDESRQVIEALAEVPDLWDVNIREWRRDSMPSRFGPEGSQEEFIGFVKKLTTKPVVGVGRFTSPDTMVSQIRRGILDFTGAARPSIADPFLPKKIEEGRIDDIRECIGCNMCVTSDFTMVPMRCTQNPTIEEWRKDWHPEIIPAKASNDRVLIVGAGPAGLECARSLGNRGYAVTVAEGREVLGGRVHDESRLAGLATWGRVRDYRVQQIQRMTNVETYLGSKLTAADILDYGFPRVVLATGASWRRDGIARWRATAISGLEQIAVFTPEDVFAATPIIGPIVIYDDDHYYMAGVLAEQLRLGGADVTLVTPASDVSSWTKMTLEQTWIEERLYQLAVKVVEKHGISSASQGEVRIEHTGNGREQALPCASLVLVTMRLPKDELFQELEQDSTQLASAGIKSLIRIGDCLAPSTIAAAVYSGHRFARELDAPLGNDEVPFKRELIALEQGSEWNA